MTILAISDDQFGGLCRALELEALLDDPRFRTVELRMRHADVLAGRLDSRTESRTTAALCARLEAEQVPHAPVNRLEDLHRDPQVVANGLLVELEHPHCGRMRTPRPVTRFEATPPAMRRFAPALGEHTHEVLSELGFAEAEIADLRAKGIVEAGQPR